VTSDACPKFEIDTMQDRNVKCLILASGFGTRLYPLTLSKAKALLEYNGKPLLTHLVNKLPKDIDIIITVNRKFEADFYQWQSNINRNVEICVEDVWTEEQSKGAIGSLYFCVKQKNIDDDILVLAGDDYFEFDLLQFIGAYNGVNTLVAVHDIRDKNKATRFGVVKLSGNRIIEFQEKPKEPKSALIATACYILPKNLLPTLSKYCSEAKRDNLGSFIAYLLDSHEVHAYPFTEMWIDIASVY